jgi:hypothetical protein
MTPPKWLSANTSESTTSAELAMITEAARSLTDIRSTSTLAAARSAAVTTSLLEGLGGIVGVPDVDAPVTLDPDGPPTEDRDGLDGCPDPADEDAEGVPEEDVDTGAADVEEAADTGPVALAPVVGATVELTVVTTVVSPRAAPEHPATSVAAVITAPNMAVPRN